MTKHELTEVQYEEYQRLQEYEKYSRLFLTRAQMQLSTMSDATTAERNTVRVEGYDSLKLVAVIYKVIV